MAETRSVQADVRLDVDVFRWGGPSMAVGAVLVAAFPLLHPAHDAAGYAGTWWAPIHLLPHVGFILIMAGLPRLLLTHAAEGGRLLRFGVVGTYVGMALMLGQAMVEAFVFPIWAIESPERLTSPPPVGAGAFMAVGSLAFMVGLVVLGIAIARRRTALPGRAGVLVALGAPAFGLGGAALDLQAVFVTGGLVLGAGLLWTGLALGSELRGPSTP